MGNGSSKGGDNCVSQVSTVRETSRLRRDNVPKTRALRRRASMNSTAAGGTMRAGATSSAFDATNRTLGATGRSRSGTFMQLNNTARSLGTTGRRMSKLSRRGSEDDSEYSTDEGDYDECRSARSGASRGSRGSAVGRQRKSERDEEREAATVAGATTVTGQGLRRRGSKDGTQAFFADERQMAGNQSAPRCEAKAMEKVTQQVRDAAYQARVDRILASTAGNVALGGTFAELEASKTAGGTHVGELLDGTRRTTAFDLTQTRGLEGADGSRTDANATLRLNAMDNVRGARVNGTHKVKQLLQKIFQFRLTMRTKRAMSDADVEELQHQQAQYAKLKRYVAGEIGGLGECIDIFGRTNKEDVVRTVALLLEESDARDGNSELLNVCLKQLDLPWSAVALQQDWIIRVTRDGSSKFLDHLLALPSLHDGDVSFDPVEVLATGVAHPERRIPLCSVLLKHWSTMRVEENRREMAPLWQELFAGVASSQKALPNEERPARMSLLSKMMSLSHLISIDINDMDDDDETVASRCIVDGDVALLRLLQSHYPADEFNQALPTGDSYLMLAVRHNHRYIVDALLELDDLDLDYEKPGEGNALDVAYSMGDALHGAIKKALETAFKAAESEPEQIVPAPVTRDAAGVMEKEKRLPYFLTHPEAHQLGPEWDIDTTSPPVTAPEQVVTRLRELFDAWEAMDGAKEALLAGEDQAQYFALERDAAAMKLGLAQMIFGVGTRVVIQGDGKALVQEAVERMLAEGEVEGNCELLRMLMYRVITVNFAPLVGQRHWASRAARQSQLTILELLLRVQKLWAEEEVVDVTRAIVREAKQNRCPLANLLLRYQDQLRLGTHRQHVRPYFQELFDSLCTTGRLRPDELRGRVELLYRLCTCPFVDLHYDHEVSSGAHTIFTRACREGDEELVRVFLDLVMVKNVNRVHTSGSTALIQAVVGNNVGIVDMLLKEPDIDPTVVSPHGSALDIAAKKDDCSLEIVNALQEAVREHSRKIITGQIQVATPVKRKKKKDPDAAEARLRRKLSTRNAAGGDSLGGTTNFVDADDRNLTRRASMHSTTRSSRGRRSSGADV